MAIDFELDNGWGHRARLGLVVLQSDETIEAEFSRVPAELTGVSLLHTRIPSGRDVTVQSLADMHASLPRAVRLFPAGLPLDVIGYGCTSGATIIGEAAVADAIRTVHPDAKVTNPLTALKAACAVMNIATLGIITPYEKPVTDALAENLVNHGIHIPAVQSFDQTSEATVARITAASVTNALVQADRISPVCDAWFVSCTNLRMAALTANAETALGKPVLSSNQVLAWHMLRSAGVTDVLNNWGTLFTYPGTAQT